MNALQTTTPAPFTTPNYNTVEIKEYGTKSYQVSKDYWFSLDTIPAVIDAILAAAASGERIRLYMGDTTSGKDYGERYDVTGKVGRSMGPVKIPLLIHNSRSMGGIGISTAGIVKMRYNGKNGRTLYQHPTYNAGVYTYGPNTDEAAVAKGYLYQVEKDGQRVYGCKTEKQAIAEVAFMTA